MKPPPFAYHRPSTLEEALSLLATHAEDAKPLAGGQSLVPLLNMRLARPGHLIDLNRVEGLAQLEAAGDRVAAGALVRQRDLEESTPVQAACPLLGQALRHVGHPPIRNRGTVCGSLAHADPAAELPAASLALEAELRVRSQRGERLVPARDFFVSVFTTCLEPDELVVEARFPRLPPGSGSAYREVARRHGDFAIAGVAALLSMDGGRIARARLALAGVGPTPLRAAAAEELLGGEAPSPELFAEAGEAAARWADPAGDLHGSAEYRRQLVRVLVRDALGCARRRSAGGA